MLQALFGMPKSRDVFAANVGPPKGPVVLRVSATRHGVMGTKRDATDPPVLLCVTVIGWPAISMDVFRAAPAFAAKPAEITPVPLELGPELTKASVSKIW